MDEFRKNLHVAYKQILMEMIILFLEDLGSDENVKNLNEPEDLRQFITNWVNQNCLPMGDFDK